MLFDSDKMKILRKKYRDTPDLFAPEVIKLDRFETLSKEREYLEEILQSVSWRVQKKWLGDFSTANNGQHLSAWFEMMLYGWLDPIGCVHPEPEIEGNLPDFSLKTYEQEIFIEARSVSIEDQSRKKQARHSELFSVIEQTERSFIIVIEKYNVGGRLDVNEILISVTNWLDRNPEKSFNYLDAQNNEIVLSAKYEPNTAKVGVIDASSEAIWVNPEPLKRPIKKKAKQHRGLRHKDHPYIIALFLESWIYTAEEIVRVWFGNTQFVLNMHTPERVRQTIDRSGLHFWGRKIRHKTVSGSLVFKVRFNEAEKRRKLFGWYIQNPYANVPVNYSDFPVQAWFEKQQDSSGKMIMGWSRNSNALWY